MSKNRNDGRVSGGPSPVRARIGREVSARLEANPGIRRAKTDAAQMYTYPDFLSAAECDTLIALIDSNSRPSTLLAVSEDPDYRTSHSSDLHRWSEEILTVDRRIADLLGIPEENADEMRAGNDGNPVFLSNNAGGILGGMSTGQDVVVTVTTSRDPVLRGEWLSEGALVAA